jgi:hypothetical protein
MRNKKRHSCHKGGYVTYRRKYTYLPPPSPKFQFLNSRQLFEIQIVNGDFLNFQIFDISTIQRKNEKTVNGMMMCMLSE